MSYQNHPAIVEALRVARNWLTREGDIVCPASVAREIVKLTTEVNNQCDRACQVAAFSLLLFQKELNADNVAWLVRDSAIGHPERPTFNFLEAY